MFFRNQKTGQIEAQAYLRRICDLTSPNLPRFDDNRGDTRQNRTLPVLLAPWRRKGVEARAAMTALTRDISDRGLSVTLPMPVNVQDVAIGLWLKSRECEPWFFLGAVRHNVAIGGGFWALGIEIVRRLDSYESGEFAQLVHERL
jgi:hypothetical protein